MNQRYVLRTSLHQLTNEIQQCYTHNLTILTMTILIILPTILSIAITGRHRRHLPILAHLLIPPMITHALTHLIILGVIATPLNNVTRTRGIINEQTVDSTPTDRHRHQESDHPQCSNSYRRDRYWRPDLYASIPTGYVTFFCHVSNCL